VGGVGLMVAPGNDRGGVDRGYSGDILVSQVGEECVPVRKAHSLIGQVYDPRNLVGVWECVRDNRGAGGVDRVSIDRFEQEKQRYLTMLGQRLVDGRYRPQPVRRVEIEKPGLTVKRPLGIPTVIDRVCQQAVRQVLEPIFEPTFSEISFGFGRSGRRIRRCVGFGVSCRRVGDGSLMLTLPISSGRSRMTGSSPWWRNESLTARC
jgi:hypothetical protein